MANHQLTLELLPGTIAICRMDPHEIVPAWATGPFLSVTSTEEELSIVCRQNLVPEGVRCEPGWRCLRVVGPLDFSLVGILASLLMPLADAYVSVFALSTFDTDYLFVKEATLDAAMEVLRQAGHSIRSNG